MLLCIWLEHPTQTVNVIQNWSSLTHKSLFSTAHTPISFTAASLPPTHIQVKLLQLFNRSAVYNAKQTILNVHTLTSLPQVGGLMSSVSHGLKGTLLLMFVNVTHIASTISRWPFKHQGDTDLWAAPANTSLTTVCVCVCVLRVWAREWQRDALCKRVCVFLCKNKNHLPLHLHGLFIQSEFCIISLEDNHRCSPLRWKWASPIFHPAWARNTQQYSC